MDTMYSSPGFKGSPGGDERGCVAERRGSGKQSGRAKTPKREGLLVQARRVCLDELD